jgi:hypothetical protein
MGFFYMVAAIYLCKGDIIGNCILLFSFHFVGIVYIVMMVRC